jgi:hypothetical protein
MLGNKYKPPYQFSTHIGAACAMQFRTFGDLAEKLHIDLTDLMRLKISPQDALRAIDGTVDTLRCLGIAAALWLTAWLRGLRLNRALRPSAGTQSHSAPGQLTPLWT